MSNRILPIMNRARFALLLLGLAFLSPNAHAVPVLDQSYVPTVGCCFGIGQATSGGAQTFTVGIGGLLSSFEVTLDGHPLSGLYDGTVTLEIQDSTFSTSLFSTTIAKTDIDTNGFSDYAFDVSAANILVNAGDVLAIVIEETGEGALSWSADFNADANYAGGASFGLFSGSYIEFSRDGAFRTFVDPQSAPEPSILALFALGILGLGLSRRTRA